MTLSTDKRIEAWAQITRADGTVEEPRLVAIHDPRPEEQAKIAAMNLPGEIHTREERSPCES